MAEAHGAPDQRRSRTLVVTSLLLALSACKDGPAQGTGERAAESSSSGESTKRPSNELRLTGESLEADGVVLGKPVAGAFDKDLYDKLRGLADAPPAKRALSIRLTRDATFSPLLDLVSNINSGRDDDKLISLSAAVEGGAPGVYPLPSRKPDKEPVVRIVLSEDGFLVELSGSRAAPGCEVVGSGVSIPRKDSKLDVDGLKRCLGTLKSQEALTNATASIGTSPSSSAAELVETAALLLQSSDSVPIVWIDAFECSERTCVSKTFREAPSAASSGGLIGLGNNAPTDPKGNSAIGGASVSGGNVANARAVVAGMAAGFRRCYNKGLAEDPNMKGDVRVTAKIGPKGEVLSATPAGAKGLSPAVVDCVAQRVSSAQFDPPDGGGAVIVIPVSFYPQ